MKQDYEKNYKYYRNTLGWIYYSSIIKNNRGAGTRILQFHASSYDKSDSETYMKIISQHGLAKCYLKMKNTATIPL